jgi:hypothetical protein
MIANSTIWWYWYVLKHVSCMYCIVQMSIFCKYMMIHTFAIGNLRAGIPQYIPETYHSTYLNTCHDTYEYMYIHTNTCNNKPTRRRRGATACAPARLRFIWGLWCMSVSVHNNSAWLRGHVRAQGDPQRALSCFLGRSPMGCGRPAPQLGAPKLSAGHIRPRCSPQLRKHIGSSVSPAERAERR